MKNGFVGVRAWPCMLLGRADNPGSCPGITGSLFTVLCAHMYFASKRWHLQISSREHPLTIGAASPADAKNQKRSEVHSPPPTSPQPKADAGIGKPRPLPWGRRKRFSGAITLQSVPPGSRLRQGLCLNYLPACLFPLSLSNSLVSPGSTVLIRHLHKNPSSWVCFWRAQPKTLVMHEWTLRKHETRFLLYQE